MAIKFAQTNAQRCSSVMTELIRRLTQEDIDILVIQEPYNNFDKLLLPSYYLYLTTTPNSWSSAFCKKNLHPFILTNLCNQHTLSLSIQINNQPLTISNLYCQYSLSLNPFINMIESIISATQNNNLLISMDSNSKSALWHSSTTDERGRQLEDLIHANRLLVLNEPSIHTSYSTSRGASNIDITLCSQDILPKISHWSLHPDWSTSDHAVISFTYNTLPSTVDRSKTNATTRIRFRYADADWELFRATLIKRIENLKQSHQDTNSAAQALSEIILDTARTSIPSPSPRPSSNPWWTTNLNTIRRTYLITKHRLQRLRGRNSTTLEDLTQATTIYRKARNSYCSAIDKAKEEYLTTAIKKARNSDPWAAINKYIKPLQNELLPSLIKPDGTYTTSLRETTDLLLNSLLPTIRSNNPTPPIVGVNSINRSCLRFNIDDLFEASDLLKPKKAPGIDNITNEILKQAVITIPSFFLDLFNNCLQSGSFPRPWKQALAKFILKSPEKIPQIPKSYRPICLLSNIGKLLERMMLQKLKKIFKLHHPRQYGFTSGKSTTDAIHDMTSFVRSSRQKYIAGIIIDIEGAFDSLNWQILLNKLIHMNCPDNLFRLIENYFSERSVITVVNNAQYNTPLFAGTPQGAILSPTFWNILFNPVILSICDLPNTHVVCYADDMIILCEGMSRAELGKHLQTALNCALQSTAEVGLKISDTKTEALLLKGKLNKDRPPTLKIDSKSVPWVQCKKFLGTIIDSGLTYIPNARYIQEKTGAITGKLIRATRLRSNLTPKILKILYKSLIVPIITLNAGAWIHRASHSHVSRILISAQRPFLLYMSHACRTTSNEALQVLCGAPPADLLAISIGAKYLMKSHPHSNLSHENPILPNIIPAEYNDQAIEPIESIISNTINDLWQNKWTNSTKGRDLFEWIDNVKFVDENDWFQLNFQLSCALTGHGFFRSKLHFLGLIDSPLCPCGSPQSSLHIIFNCPLTNQSRSSNLNQHHTVPASLLASEPDFISLRQHLKEIFLLKKQNIL